MLRCVSAFGEHFAFRTLRVKNCVFRELLGVLWSLFPDAQCNKFRALHCAEVASSLQGTGYHRTRAQGGHWYLAAGPSANLYGMDRTKQASAKLPCSTPTPMSCGNPRYSRQDFLGFADISVRLTASMLVAHNR